MSINRNFDCFQYSNFEVDFLEKKSYFKKLEYHFSVEGTKIEIAPFPYKTAISEANAMINRMVSAKWTYHKKRSLPVTSLSFGNFVSV